MKLVLFIGHHKVGSTSIQVFMAQNYFRLLQQGILYPAVESEGFVDHMARILAGADYSGVPPMNVREPHNALAFRFLADARGSSKVPDFHNNLPATRQMLEALRNQINQLSPETVILCSEVMSNFGPAAPDAIDTLRDLFSEAEIQVYCALRRPDEYLASWHSQRLKFGHKIEPLRECWQAEYRRSVHFDYRRLLEPWLQRMPKARFTIRTYSEALATGGSIEDFVAQAGLDLPSNMIPAPHANLSLPAATAEIVRRANHQLAPADASDLRNYLQQNSRSFDLPKNNQVEVLGARERGHLAEAFSPIHDWLGQITDKPDFFPDVEQIGKLRPVSEAEATASALRQLKAPPESAGRLTNKLKEFLRELSMPEAVADNLQSE